MDRRAFFGLLGMGAAGMVLDPELALWMPGQKTIFLPPAGGWDGQTPLTPEWITKELMKHLQRELELMKIINRKYDAAFLNEMLPVRVGIQRPIVVNVR